MHTRRDFLGRVGTGVLSAGFMADALSAQSDGPAKQYRAAVIGRTGGGDYGHGYDQIFNGLSNVSVEAVADADPEGAKKAAERCKAKRTYADYREMLAKEKPDLVSIAPRHPDCHLEMAVAAAEVASGIFMEKPMTESAEAADAILKAAEKRRVKIAVAHNRRITPDFVKIKYLIEEGFLGTVLDVRAQGKQDARVGGEDMIVLGTHDFDLMRFYFGDPLWCSASVLAEGRPIAKKDVRQGNEPILVAGDTVRAVFAFPNNIQFAWNSVKSADDWNRDRRERWSFLIQGSKRTILHQSGFGIAYMDSPFLAYKNQTAEWKPLPNPKQWPPPPEKINFVRDLIRAIETDTQPICSGYDGRWAVEMVAAVYESERLGRRAPLPLKERSNPLLKFT